MEIMSKINLLIRDLISLIYVEFLFEYFCQCMQPLVCINMYVPTYYVCISLEVCVSENF